MDGLKLLARYPFTALLHVNHATGEQRLQVNFVKQMKIFRCFSIEK